jgi:hypothetical protein
MKPLLLLLLLAAPAAGAVIGGLLLGTASAAIGALFGWAVQTERWQRLRLPGGTAGRWSCVSECEVVR